MEFLNPILKEIFCHRNGGIMRPGHQNTIRIRLQVETFCFIFNITNKLDSLKRFFVLSVREMQCKLKIFILWKPTLGLFISQVKVQYRQSALVTFRKPQKQSKTKNCKQQLLHQCQSQVASIACV